MEIQDAEVRIALDSGTLRKRNTVLHPKWLSKFCIFATCSRIWDSLNSPTPQCTVYEDNTACIEWGNHVIGGREHVKHIDIRKHFAHEVIQNQEMRLIKVDTSLQLADIFTKPLPYSKFHACIQRILRKNTEVTRDNGTRTPNAPRGSGGGS
jgi:hypothetical protein